MPTATWKDVPRRAVLDALDLCEGHGILDSGYLRDQCGLPQELVNPLVDQYVSDFTDNKQTIYAPDDGQPTVTVTGIHDLTLVRAICDGLGLPTGTPFLGRGRECRALVERIRTYYRDEPNPPSGAPAPESEN